MRRTPVRLLLLSLCLIAAHSALGQASGRPVRLVRLFDFEDTDDQGVKLGLGHDLPRHFFAMGRDPLVPDPFFYELPLHKELIHRSGYPAFATVRFDTEQVAGGDYSLKLTADGGNAGAFVEVGALAAVPGSDYRVTTKLRTVDTTGAAARLTAYFIDAAGVRIEPSVARSRPLRTAGRWIDASVTLTGDFPQAAWIGIEIELLQPLPDRDNPLGKQQIIFPDVTASAWFDDIAVWQLPHVQVSTESPLNIHRGPDPPRLDLTMRDLTGRQLLATAVVYNHKLERIDRVRRRVGAGAPTQWHWTPKLPGYGWYLIDLSIADALSDAGTIDESAEPMARTMGAVLWLPDEGPVPATDAGRFTIVAEGLPPEQRDLIPILLDQTGLHSVVLSIWDRDDTLATLERRIEQLDEMLNRTVSAQRQVTLSMHPVPRELAETEGVNASHALGVLQADPDLWMPYLSPVLRRHGQRVRRWQIGEAQRAEAFFYEDPAAVLGQVRRQIEQMAPGPRLVVPWRLEQARRDSLDNALTFAIDVPPGIPADALSDYLEEWRTPPASVALYLREPPADAMAPQSRLDELALRMVEGWSAGVESIAIDSPWTDAAERRAAVLPDPLLGVFINTAHRLAGRRVVAQDVPIGRGLRAVVLDGSRGGMMMVWAESAAGEDATLRTVLGEDPVAIDLWGNRTPLPVVDGKHVLRLTGTPLFIEGIDPYLAMLRAGFALDEPFIESRQEPHRRTVLLTNPYPVTIAGRLTITGPRGWDISPLNHVFSIAPGQTARLPVVIRFPLAEVAGPKHLTARAEFDADRHYNIDLSSPVELGLTDVEFNATVTLEQGPDGRLDALLTTVVTNVGDRPRSYYLFAVLTGEPREERLVPELAPGETMIKRMRFNGVNREAKLRTGIREASGPAMLNRMLNLGDVH